MELFKTIFVASAVVYVFWFLIKLGKTMLLDFSDKSRFIKNNLNREKI